LSFVFEPIATVHTPFDDKFGVPRQPGLVQSAKGVIKFRRDAKLAAALRGLDTFTHIWIVFVFDRHGGGPWKAAIRPPRLGGAERIGVLSSRSPHRPNPIGISAVRLDRVDVAAKGGAELHVSGIDLLNQTPVLDVKPYLPYADSLPDAGSGWAAAPIERVNVTCAADVVFPDDVRDLVLQTLSLDPRPAYQKRQMPPGDPAHIGTRFGLRLAEVDVTYEIRGGGFRILNVKPVE
jgi:tRNA-Thr(GGU) m(6)t(6)A37 methyltransferase TsaA